jgi:hypothetical protein
MSDDILDLLAAIIGEASGAVSLCWVPRPTGEFDSEQAAAFVDEAVGQAALALAQTLEPAWGLIANAHEGNWDEATPEWRAAAERFRDTYHRVLDRMPKEPAEPVIWLTDGGDKPISGDSE